MNKSNGNTTGDSRLRGLAENNEINEKETPVTMAGLPVAAASRSQRKKLNRLAKRDEAEQILLLKSRIELLQNTIASLETENAGLRRDLDAERMELRTFTTALLEINQGIHGTRNALEQNLESASTEKDARFLSSNSIIFLIAMLAFIIVQIVLLIYADGYLFAL